MHLLQQKSTRIHMVTASPYNYRITYGLRDLLPDYIIYNNETKWSQEACIMKSIIKGNKEKAITISKILNLIYKYIRGRDIFDKL